MKTGRDVVMGALLGADEFGFATAPLVASGCIMMRKCHLNTCPVGIATQDPELRKKFSGKPEDVVNFFFFIAEEVRQIMAQLGVRRFDELIGRTDLLDMRQGVEHWKAQGLDFSRVFALPTAPAEVPRLHSSQQEHGLEHALDQQLIAQAQAALLHGKPVRIETQVRNTNRTVGAMLSGALIKHHPDGLADDSIHVHCTGTGGQSFAAFLAQGITFDLVGEANDYSGKGLSGGRLIVRPSRDFKGMSSDNIIVGNTVLYGATSGSAFFSGVAGERFAVRLSGASTVVEGVGDHGCEYMTGGTVVVLGQTGRNFAAGMSGGVVYVFDEAGDFSTRCNQAQVTLERVGEVLEAREISSCDDELELEGRVAIDHLEMADESILKGLIERHLRFTHSPRAQEILENWTVCRDLFVKIIPNEYRLALEELAEKRQNQLEAA